MAQVKIYACRAHLERARSALSDVIHGVLQETLGLPADKRFHRFIALDDEDFVHPPRPGRRLHDSRDRHVRGACLRRLMADVPAACGMPVNALEIVVLEAPKASWGIRGKIGDELQLDHKVET